LFFDLTVIKNSSPYFSEELPESLSALMSSSWIYTSPRIVDPEGDAYEMFFEIEPLTQSIEVIENDNGTFSVFFNASNMDDIEAEDFVADAIAAAREFNLSIVIQERAENVGDGVVYSMVIKLRDNQAPYFANEMPVR